MGVFKDMEIKMQDKECCGGHHCGQDVEVISGCFGENISSQLSDADIEAIKNTQWGGWSMLDALAYDIFDANKAKGFWDEAVIKDVPFERNGEVYYDEDFVPSRRNTGELIALMHSELSEALEAHRKDKMDDHLPQYKGVHVELADALIRILDYCGAHDVKIGNIVRDKLEYNKNRPYKHGKLF